MQINSAFFDDLSKLAASAASSALDVRREAEAAFAAKLDGYMQAKGFAGQAEFAVVKEMALKALAENEKLETRLSAMEAKIAELAAKRG